VIAGFVATNRLDYLAAHFLPALMITSLLKKGGDCGITFDVLELRKVNFDIDENVLTIGVTPHWMGLD